MQWIKLALAGPLITGLGACGTLGLNRSPVVVQAPPPPIPVECRLAPVERREVAEPSLAPEAGDTAEIARARLFNAQLAFLFWRDRAAAAEEQADVNAASQAKCADWAVTQP